LLEEEAITSLRFLQAVYRNPEVPLPVRMRAAMAAIPFEHPKFAVVATVDGNSDFAAQLDRAAERSRRVLMIEAKPIEANASSKVTVLTPAATTSAQSVPIHHHAM
jgi:hypothetical protein